MPHCSLQLQSHMMLWSILFASERSRYKLLQYQHEHTLIHATWQAGGDRKLVRTDSRAQTLDRFLRPSPRSASGGSPSPRPFSPSASGPSPTGRASPGPFSAPGSYGGGGGGDLCAGGVATPGSNPSRLGPLRDGGGATPAAAAAAAAAGVPARRKGADRGLLRVRDTWEGAGAEHGADAGAAGGDDWGDMVPGDVGGLEALAGLGQGSRGGARDAGRAVRPRLAPPACKLDSILELLAEVDQGAHHGRPCLILRAGLCKRLSWLAWV